MDKNTINSVKDFLDEREKFRALMNEILSLMRAESTASENFNETTKIREKVGNNDQLRAMLQIFYETFRDEDISSVRDGITCRREYSELNEEIPPSIHDFDAYSSVTPDTIDDRESQTIEGKLEPAGYCEPMAIIVYESGRKSNNRSRRITRLKSRIGKRRQTARDNSDHE